MKLHIESPGPAFKPEYAYIRQVVFEHFLGIPTLLSTGRHADSWRIHTPAGGLDLPNAFFPEAAPETFLDSARIPEKAHRVTFRDNEYAAMFAAPTPEDPGVDILGTIFFLLTSFEDHLALPRDEYDCLRPESTWMGRNDLLLRPIVDELLDLLEYLLRRSEVNFPARRRDYAFVYSCDVDRPTLWHSMPWPLYLRELAGSLVKRFSPKEFAGRLAATFSAAHDPFYTFGWICEQLEAAGTSGCFNFGGQGNHPLYDMSYSLASPAIRDILALLTRRGHEIGFHPSYRAADDERVFKDELKGLKAAYSGDIRGGRQHYLRFKGASTWRWWEEAGLEYDSSLGYNGAPGFRCGTAREFPVFDLERRIRLSLCERPLIAMEGTLLHILGFTHAETFDLLVSLSNTIRKSGGSMTMLWHNSTLVSFSDRELFKEAIKALA